MFTPFLKSTHNIMVYKILDTNGCAVSVNWALSPLKKELVDKARYIIVCIYVGTKIVLIQCNLYYLEPCLPILAGDQKIHCHTCAEGMAN